MKKLILLMALATYSFSTEMCYVEICNKLERFTLDPFSMIKDNMGKHCYNVEIPKSQAKVGKVLSSESRWYQGSFNPTKKSVTKITKIHSCRNL